jgi:hypothetical protein
MQRIRNTDCSVADPEPGSFSVWSRVPVPGLGSGITINILELGKNRCLLWKPSTFFLSVPVCASWRGVQRARRGTVKVRYILVSATEMLLNSHTHDVKLRTPNYLR